MASYGFCFNPRIKIEFCPYGVDVSLDSPNKDGVYMHPQVLALGLRLSMLRFIRSVLIFYRVASSQLSAMALCTVLGFKAICDLYAPKVVNIRSSAPHNRKGGPLKVHATLLSSGVEKIIVNMVNNDHGM